MSNQSSVNPTVGDGVVTVSNQNESEPAKLREYVDPVKNNIVSDKPVLKGLLEAVTSYVSLPEGATVYLEGSIAEGFGNCTSDVDFVFIDHNQSKYAVMPELIFISGYRIEVRVRSITKMRSEIELLRDALKMGDHAIANIPEEVLDRCQRFKNSIGVKNENALELLKQELPVAELQEIVSRWFTVNLNSTLQNLALMKVLERESEAVSWARSAMIEGTKSWLATQGETYLAKKWLMLQLQRSDNSKNIAAFQRLESLSKSKLSSDEYIAMIEQQISDYDISAKFSAGENLFLRWRDNVTTWELGGNVHIVVDRKYIYGLSKLAGRVWRSLTKSASLDKIMETVRLPKDEMGRLIALFHRLGFVDIENKSGDLEKTSLTRKRARLPVSPAQPMLSVAGLNFCESESSHIRLCSVSASIFAACGMQLSYSNMNIENAREDAIGALDSGQWSVFEWSLRRILKHINMTILSSYGYQQIPSDEELFDEVSSLDGIDVEIKQGVANFNQSLNVTDKSSADEAFGRLDSLVLAIRDQTNNTLFPACFMDADKWQDMLNIGYDWTRLGAYLNAEFPTEQARDLISFSSIEQKTQQG